MPSHKRYYDSDSDGFHTPTRMHMAAYGRYTYDNPNFVAVKKYPVQRPFYNGHTDSEYSSDDSLISRRQKNHMFLAGIILLTILIIAAAMAVGIYFATNQTRTQMMSEVPKSKIQTEEGKKAPDATITATARNYQWNSELADPQSARFGEVALAFEKELDAMFKSSDLADIYDSSVVTSLRAGSVVCVANVIFIENTPQTSEALKQKKAKYKNEPQIFATAVKEVFLARAKQRAENNDESGVVFDSSNVESVIVTTTTPTTTTTTATTTTTTTATTTPEMTTEAVAETTQGPDTATTGGPDTETTQGPDTETTQGPDTATTGGPDTETTQGPDTETTEGPDTETTQGPDTETTQGPDTETTQGPDTETTQGPDTATTEGPDTETTQGPDTETTQGPDTETTQGPDTETTQGPDTETTQGPDTETTQGPDTETTQGPDTETTQGPDTETTERATELTTELTVETTTVLSTEPTTTPAPEEELLPDIETNITVTNYEWNDAFNDTESPEYQNLTAGAVAQIDSMMMNSNASEYYNRTEVQSVSQGSVIIVCIIIMNPIPVTEAPSEIVELSEKPNKFLDVLKEGAERLKKIQDENPSVPKVSNVEFDVEAIVVVVVKKLTKCQRAVVDVGDFCQAAYEDFEQKADRNEDTCTPYKYFVNCLRFMVQFLGRKQCNVYHVNKAADYYIERNRPGYAWNSKLCTGSNGQVDPIVQAVTRTDNICLDANTVMYLSRYDCQDELYQAKTQSYTGTCSPLDALSACVYGSMSDFTSVVGKTMGCGGNDIKQTFIDYEDDIIGTTKLPSMCFGKGDACNTFSKLEYMSNMHCREAMDRLNSSSGGVSTRCSAYVALGRCLVYAFHEDGCDSTTLHAVSSTNIETMKTAFSGFDPSECDVPMISAVGMCSSSEYYEYIWDMHCELDESSPTDQPCSPFFKQVYCVVDSSTKLQGGCGIAHYMDFMDGNREKFKSQYQNCINEIKVTVEDPCLQVTSPNFGMLAMCLQVLSVGNRVSSTCGNGELALHTQSMKCIKRRMTTNSCSLHQISQSYADYAPMMELAAGDTAFGAMFKPLTLCAESFKKVNTDTVTEFCRDETAIIQLFIGYVKMSNITSLENMNSSEIASTCYKLFVGFEMYSRTVLESSLGVKCDTQAIIAVVGNNTDVIRSEISGLDLSRCEGITDTVNDPCLDVTSPSFGNNSLCLAGLSIGNRGSETCGDGELAVHTETMKCIKRRTHSKCTLQEISQSYTNYESLAITTFGEAGYGGLFKALHVCAETFKTAEVDTVQDICSSGAGIAQIFIGYLKVTMNVSSAINLTTTAAAYGICKTLPRTTNTVLEAYLGVKCSQETLNEQLSNNSETIKAKIPDLDISVCKGFKFCKTLFGQGINPDAGYNSNYTYSNYTSSNYTGSNYISSNYTGSNYTTYSYSNYTTYSYSNSNNAGYATTTPAASYSDSSSTVTHTSSPGYGYSPAYMVPSLGGYFPPNVPEEYIPNVYSCSYLMSIPMVYPEISQEVKCRLRAEGLRCMEEKGSIYGETCGIDDFHQELSLVSPHTIPASDNCSDTYAAIAMNQEPLCNNSELLATIANVMCMRYLHSFSSGCGMLQMVVDCLDRTLNSSSHYCCKEALWQGVVSGAAIIKAKYPEHDFSECGDSKDDSSDDGGTDMSSMLPCPTGDTTLQRMYWYCSFSIRRLNDNKTDEGKCKLNEDTFHCLSIASNYNNYSCTVNDILMIHRKNPAVFGINFNSDQCPAVKPVAVRQFGTSPCLDEFFINYMRTYACPQFSEEEIHSVTDINFCRKVKETRQCLQTTLAGLGIFCSLANSTNMLRGIPRTEYLGCVDSCRELDYKGSCDENVAPIEEIGVCFKTVISMVGKSQDEQCRVYWPRVVECVQAVIFHGGAACDGNNIALRIRKFAGILLLAWGVTSTETCLKDATFTPACESKALVSQALTYCYKTKSFCGQEEIDKARTCAENQFSYRIWGNMCNMYTLNALVGSILTEQEHQQKCSDGQVRLTEDGSVQIISGDKWGTVCQGPDWDDSAAAVVCKELRYKYGFASSGYRDYGAPIFVYNVSCNGTEDRFIECDYDREKTSACSQGAVARCMNQKTMISISGGGRGGWIVAQRGTNEALVCDSEGFYEDDATVVCQSEGYESGEVYYEVPKPLPLSKAFKVPLRCQGIEDSIDGCVNGEWDDNPVDVSGLNAQDYYEHCSMWNMGRVYCHDSVRLHRQYGNSTGIVLTTKGKQKYPVCSEGFDNNAAKVVCKKLGFPAGGEALDHNPYLNQQYYDYRVNNISCTGDEPSLWDCKYQMGGEDYYNYCPSKTPAVVKCYTGKTEIPDWEMKVDQDGRVWVSRYGVFGTICPKGWTEKETQFICKSQGYSSGYTRTMYHSSDKVPFWMTYVSCSDSALSIKDCSYNTSDEDYCGKDAGVYCYNMSEVPEYSIDKGSADNYGYVYATINDTTAVVCGSYWNDENSKVLCRSIGYKGGETYRGHLRDVGGTSAWFGNYFNCDGDEKLLDMCRDVKWSLVNMEGSKSADGMVTTMTPCRENLARVFCYGDVKLHTGYFNRSGLVKVFEPGKERYMSICSEGFTDEAATVVCRQLKLSDKGIVLSPSSYSDYYSDIGRRNATCDGTESSIFDCTESGNCYGGAATVLCNDTATINDPITEVMVKSDNSSNEDGLVLVKRFGIWGTTCYDSWSWNNTQVVCRGEGYDTGFTKRMYMSQREERWLGRANCTGEEKSLLECDHSTEFTGNCVYNYYAPAVKCFKNDDLASYSFVKMDDKEGHVGWVAATRYNETYPLCDDGWVSYDDARVLCRHFGFETGTSKDGLSPNTGYKHFWKANMNCLTSDTDPNACIENWRKTEEYGCYSGLVKLTCVETYKISGNFRLAMAWEDVFSDMTSGRAKELRTVFEKQMTSFFIMLTDFKRFFVTRFWRDDGVVAEYVTEFHQEPSMDMLKETQDRAAKTTIWFEGKTIQVSNAANETDSKPGNDSKCGDVDKYKMYESYCGSEVQLMKGNPTCNGLVNVSRCLSEAMCLDGTHCTAGEIAMSLRYSNATEHWLGLKNAEDECNGLSLPVNICDDSRVVTCAFKQCAPEPLEMFMQQDYLSQCRIWDNMTDCTITSLTASGHKCDNHEVENIVNRFGEDTVNFTATSCPTTTDPPKDKCKDVNVFKNYEYRCGSEIQMMKGNPNCNGLLNVSRCLSSAMCETGTHCTIDEIFMTFRYSNLTEPWLGLKNAKYDCDGLNYPVDICDDLGAITCVLMQCTPRSVDEFRKLDFSLQCSIWGNITDCTLVSLNQAGQHCDKNVVTDIMDRIGQDMVNITSTSCSQKEDKGANKCRDVNMYKSYDSQCGAEFEMLKKDPGCSGLLNVSRCLSDAMCVAGTHCTVGEIIMSFRYSNITEQWLELKNAQDTCDGLVLPVEICEDDSAVNCAFMQCAPGQIEEFMSLDFPTKCSVWRNMTHCTMESLSKSGHSCRKENIMDIVNRFGTNTVNFNSTDCPMDTETNKTCRDVNMYRSYESQCGAEVQMVKNDPGCNGLLNVSQCLSNAMCVAGTHCTVGEIIMSFRYSTITEQWLELKNAQDTCDGLVLPVEICEDDSAVNCAFMRCAPGPIEEFMSLDFPTKCSVWRNMTHCTMESLSKSGHSCRKENIMDIVNRFGTNTVNFNATDCPMDTETNKTCRDVNMYRSYESQCGAEVQMVKNDPGCNGLLNVSQCLSNAMCVAGTHCTVGEIIMSFRYSTITEQWLELKNAQDTCDGLVLPVEICEDDSAVNCAFMRCAPGPIEEFMSLDFPTKCSVWRNMTHCTMESLSKSGHSCRKENIMDIVNRFGTNTVNFNATDCPMDTETNKTCRDVNMYRSYESQCGAEVQMVKNDPGCNGLLNVSQCLSNAMCVAGTHCTVGEIIMSFRYSTITEQWLELKNAQDTCDGLVLPVEICEDDSAVNCAFMRCAPGPIEEFMSLDFPTKCSVWRNMTHCTMESLSKSGHSCRKENIMDIVNRFGTNTVNFNATDCPMDTETNKTCRDVNMYRSYESQCGAEVQMVKNDPGCNGLLNVSQCLSNAMCVAGTHCTVGEIIMSFRYSTITEQWLELKNAQDTCDGLVLPVEICEDDSAVNCAFMRCAPGPIEEFMSLDFPTKCSVWRNMTHCTMESLSKSGHSCRKENIMDIVNRFGTNTVNFNATDCPMDTETNKTCRDVNMYRSYESQCGAEVQMMKNDPGCNGLLNVSQCLSNAMCVAGTHCTVGEIIMSFRYSNITEQWLELKNAQDTCDGLVLPVEICEDDSAVNCAFMRCAPGPIEEFMSLDFPTKCSVWRNMTHCTMESLSKSGHSCRKENIMDIVNRFGTNTVNFNATDCPMDTETNKTCRDVNMYRSYESQCGAEVQMVKNDPGCNGLLNVSQCLSNAMCVAGTHCTVGEIIMSFRYSTITEQWLELKNAQDTCDGLVLPVEICEDDSAVNCAFMRCAPGPIEEFMSLDFPTKCSVWRNMTHCTMESLSKSGHSCRKENIMDIVNRFGTNTVNFNATDCPMDTETNKTCRDVNMYRSYESQCGAEVQMVKNDPGCNGLLNVSQCLSNAMCVAGTHCTVGEIIMSFRYSNITEQWLELKNAQDTCDGLVLPVKICEDDSAVNCAFMRCAPGPIEEFMSLDFPTKCSVWRNMTHCTMDSLSKSGHNCRKENIMDIVNRFGTNTVNFNATECQMDPCLNISLIRSFEDTCTNSVTAVTGAATPTCSQLQNVSTCLSTSMCETGGYICGSDQIFQAFDDNQDTTEEWLGVNNSRALCKDAAAPNDICADRDNIICVLVKCAVGDVSAFASLGSDEKCSVWQNMTSCTLTKVSDAGHNCQSSGITNIINQFFNNDLGFDVKKECTA